MRGPAYAATVDAATDIAAIANPTGECAMATKKKSKKAKKKKTY